MEQAAYGHQCRGLRPKLVAVAPGRIHWACAESVSAGSGSRGGKEEQGMETDRWHSASALHPIRFPPLPGPQAAVLGPAIIPCLLLSPFLGPHSSQGPADLILRLFLSNATTS